MKWKWISLVKSKNETSKEWQSPYPPLQSSANQLPEEDPPRQGRWTHSWFQICTSNQKRLNGKKGKIWEFSPQISFDWQTARGGNGQIRPKFPKWELGWGPSGKNPPQSPEWRSLHVSHWCLKKLSKKTITTSSAISSLATLSIFASVPFHPKSTLVLPCLASLFTGMCCMNMKT